MRNVYQNVKGITQANVQKNRQTLDYRLLTISQTHADEAEDKYAYFTEFCNTHNEECIYAAMLEGSKILCQLVNDKAITEKTCVHYLDMLLESSSSLNRETRKDIRKGFCNAQASCKKPDYQQDNHD